MGNNVVRDDGDVIEIQFTGESLGILLNLRDGLEKSPVEVISSALSLYNTLLEWQEKGNYIDLVTPARGETRDRLELP